MRWNPHELAALIAATPCEVPFLTKKDAVGCRIALYRLMATGSPRVTVSIKDNVLSLRPLGKIDMKGAKDVQDRS